MPDCPHRGGTLLIYRRHLSPATHTTSPSACVIMKMLFSPKCEESNVLRGCFQGGLPPLTLGPVLPLGLAAAGQAL